MYHEIIIILLYVLLVSTAPGVFNRHCFARSGVHVVLPLCRRHFKCILTENIRFWFKSYWGLSRWLQLTMICHGFTGWAPKKCQANAFTNDDHYSITGIIHNTGCIQSSLFRTVRCSLIGGHTEQCRLIRETHSKSWNSHSNFRKTHVWVCVWCESLAPLGATTCAGRAMVSAYLSGRNFQYWFQGERSRHLWHMYNMMTLSNGNIFRVTGPFWGEYTGHRWFPSQRPVTWSFDVFFDLDLNKTFEQTAETPLIWHAIALIMTSL